MSTSIQGLNAADLACLRRLARALHVPAGHAIIIERGALIPVPERAKGYRFCACRPQDLPSHSGGVNVVRVDRRDLARAAAARGDHDAAASAGHKAAVYLRRAVRSVLPKRGKR